MRQLFLWLNKFERGELLTILGGLTGVVGQAIFLAGGKQPSVADYVKVIGLAVFVFGVFLAVREMSKRLERVDKAFIEKLGELTSLRFSSTEQETISTREWARTRPEEIHVFAANEVLNQMVSTYASGLVTRLRKYEVSKDAIDMRDLSPINDLIHRLVHSLPVGSVWAGITLLDDAAWASPKSMFRDFVLEMRRRAEADEIRVFRLFHLSDDQLLPKIKKVMKEEAASKVEVKYSVSTRDDTPDISLLWTPQMTMTRADPTLTVEKLLANSGKTHRAACALQYQLLFGSQLAEVKMFAGGADDFKRLGTVFAHKWGDAQSFSGGSAIKNA